MNSYGSWSLDHPWRASLTIIIPMIIGAALGVAMAAILDGTRVVTDNIVAGAALGAGGVLAGLALGLLAVRRRENSQRQDPVMTRPEA